MVTPEKVISNLLAGGRDLFFTLEDWGRSALNLPEPVFTPEHGLVLVL
jgi:hypothetical protein